MQQPGVGGRVGVGACMLAASDTTCCTPHVALHRLCSCMTFLLESKLRFIALAGCTAGAVQPGPDGKQLFNYINPSSFFCIGGQKRWHKPPPRKTLSSSSQGFFTFLVVFCLLGGLYDLDLSRPYHRSLLRMLYKKCELSGQTPASAFQIQSTSTPYSHPDKREGKYFIPSSGQISIAFSLAWRGDDEDDMWGYARVVYLTLGEHGAPSGLIFISYLEI